MNGQLDDLVASRNAQYDAAHLKTSRWIQEHLEFIAQCGDMAFSVIMIVNKLHRMEGDPKHLDNLTDIAGYARCAIEALAIMEERETSAKAGPGAWIPTEEQRELIRQGTSIGRSGGNNTTG